MADASLIPVSRVQGILRPCCGVDANLQLLHVHSPEHRYGMIVRQCRRCGRKHYELVADPGAMGVQGAGL